MHPFSTVRELQWRLFEWQLQAEIRSNKRPVDEMEPLRIVKLRSLLAQTPQWQAGHLRLAEASLRGNDIQSSFVSAQAVLVLGANSDAGKQARAIQAKCYLKRGAVAEARAIISALLAETPESSALREDLGAILIQEGDFAAAASELGKIPNENLTGEGRAALEFARSKATA